MSDAETIPPLFVPAKTRPPLPRPKKDSDADRASAAGSTAYAPTEIGSIYRHPNCADTEPADTEPADTEPADTEPALSVAGKRKSVGTLAP